MWRLFTCLCVLTLVATAQAQFKNAHWEDTDSTPPFEIYGLASAIHTVDGTGTTVIHNPTPNQAGFTPSGVASGARSGFVWAHDNVGLVIDVGFHMFSDRAGSTTLAPFIVVLCVSSEEHFRTAFFGDFLGGGYRWTMHTPDINFTHMKGAGALGGGMDIRLTRRLVLRVFELRVMLVGGRLGPQLT